MNARRLTKKKLEKMNNGAYEQGALQYYMEENEFEFIEDEGISNDEWVETYESDSYTCRVMRKANECTQGVLIKK